MYRGNCVLDYLGDGVGGPCFCLPRSGSSMTWTSNGSYTYEWSTTLAPQFEP